MRYEFPEHDAFHILLDGYHRFGRYGEHGDIVLKRRKPDRAALRGPHVLKVLAVVEPLDQSLLRGPGGGDQEAPLLSGFFAIGSTV